MSSLTVLIYHLFSTNLSSSSLSPLFEALDPLAYSRKALDWECDFPKLRPYWPKLSMPDMVKCDPLWMFSGIFLLLASRVPTLLSSRLKSFSQSLFFLMGRGGILTGSGSGGCS